ncbi:hypothetical protein O181_059283 [Austropuccinia psidii MF-1]|uniref:Major facilitator superfamily (MFS) profile domain-containing protein n=1 Tax=Austropuccinia psidii MF-1 TaxID=1389203 RepID=A0A9Q3EIH8_9BASI|nr:hypothetical protein [Austropuccinia psidii MF-1]
MGHSGKSSWLESRRWLVLMDDIGWFPVRCVDSSTALETSFASVFVEFSRAHHSIQKERSTSSGGGLRPSLSLVAAGLLLVVRSDNCNKTAIDPTILLERDKSVCCLVNFLLSLNSPSTSQDPFTVLIVIGPVDLVQLTLFFILPGMAAKSSSPGLDCSRPDFSLHSELPSDPKSQSTHPSSPPVDHPPSIQSSSHPLKSDSSNRSYEQPTAKHGLIKEIIHNKFVLRCALFVSLGGILFGYDQGVISVTLVMNHFTSRFPQIDQGRNPNGLTSFWKGFLTAMIELGAILGVTLAGFTADRHGRKTAIRFGTMFFIIGSILQTTAFHFVALLIGRFIGGIGIGLLSMTAPMYMSEISPPSIRGALLCLEEFNIVFGIVIAFWITFETRLINNDLSWRFPFGLQVLPALIILLGLSHLPSSPSWLATKGQYQKCLESLAALRQLPPEDELVRKEWIQIRVEAEFQREHNLSRYGDLPSSSWAAVKMEARKWMDTFSKSYRGRTMVGVGLMFFQQFVGINALIYYSPTLIETLGFGTELQLKMSGVMNICQLLGVSISFFIVDKLGRRPLLLFGSVIMTICHGAIAFLISRFSLTWSEYPSAGWVGVTLIMIYMIIFGVSWGPVPWAIPAEIFPSTLRAKGVAVSTMSNWINNFIIGLITPPLIQKTHQGAFLFFGGNSLLSFVFVWFFVPETANTSLEDMDKVFGDAIGADDALKKSNLLELLRRTDN